MLSVFTEPGDVDAINIGRVISYELNFGRRDQVAHPAIGRRPFISLIPAVGGYSKRLDVGRLRGYKTNNVTLFLISILSITFIGEIDALFESI